MYRKIIFLSLNLFENMGVFNKLYLYLLLTCFNSLFTFVSRPFVLRESNIIEYYSNVSLTLIIFSDLVYILTINEVIKTFFLIMTISINIIFQMNWMFRAVEVLCYAHVNTLRRYFPYFLKRIFAIINTLKTLDLNLNIESLKKFIASYNMLKKSDEVYLIFEREKFRS